MKDKENDKDMIPIKKWKAPGARYDLTCTPAEHSIAYCLVSRVEENDLDLFVRETKKPRLALVSKQRLDWYNENPCDRKLFSKIDNQNERFNTVELILKGLEYSPNTIYGSFSSWDFIGLVRELLIRKENERQQNH